MKTIIGLSLALLFFTACKKEIGKQSAKPCTSENMENGTGGATSYSYNFDNGTKGWAVEGAAKFRYATEVGNPFPCIAGVDKKASEIWYFMAPASMVKALNQNKSYDHTIMFDLLAKSSGDINYPDVILEGFGHKLVYSLGNYPSDEIWTTYSISLNESAGWRVETTEGPLATKSEIKNILLNLNKVLIRGKFSSDLNLGYLDNVTMK